MNKFDYSSLSGQHLKVFVTLHEVGTVTATADTLHTTQSAVSHSLQKLRLIFGDELFVRSGRSVVPTQRSLEIYPQIKAILDNLKQLTNQQAFEPATADISYRISANDYQQDLILPKVYNAVSPLVASLYLEIYPYSKGSENHTLELLRSQQIDLMFSPFTPNHNDIMAVRIFHDTFVCFFDATQRNAPSSLQDFRQADYIGLTFRRTLPTDDQNEEQVIQTIEAINQRTKIIVNGFSSIPYFLEGTTRLALLPSRLKDTYFQQLQYAQLPFYAPVLTMYMLWHKRYQNDPQHKWFREQVIKSTEYLRA